MTPPHPARPLLFLDYDGTLASLVDDPSAARPHPDVPALLQALATSGPLWIVTGRDLAALERLLPDLALNAVGLHGAERGTLGSEAERPHIERHSEAIDAMRAQVPALTGVWVEEKSGAFAVHYRQAEDKVAAQEVLERWAATAPAVFEPVWGKTVLELRVRGISKGTAVAQLAADHPDRTPIYIGDDVTDEDAFRALHGIAAEAVTIKVGDGETDARYRLADVEAVVQYLEGFREVPG